MMEFSNGSAKNLVLKGEDVLFLQCQGSSLGLDELRIILYYIILYYIILYYIIYLLYWTH